MHTSLSTPGNRQTHTPATLAACQRLFDAVHATYYTDSSGRLQPRTPLKLTSEQDFIRVQSAPAKGE
jgi:hypothetical protein